MTSNPFCRAMLAVSLGQRTVGKDRYGDILIQGTDLIDSIEAVSHIIDDDGDLWPFGQSLNGLLLGSCDMGSRGLETKRESRC